jgi:hypothetical protein
MDKVSAENEFKKDLRIIGDSFVYYGLRVQAAERIEASQRALAVNLAKAQDRNKLQLKQIAELEKQLASVTQERDLLRTEINNAIGMLDPYVHGVAELIRASTHVTQKLAAVREALKEKGSSGTPALKTQDEKEERV